MTLRSSDQRRYLPSFAILRSFEAAARHESFTLAAEELHLTQSAISRQIKDLEVVVGVKLFRRVGRRVQLTDAGRNFSDELTIDLDRIRQTVFRTISAGELGATLRIATLPTFANRWLIPRLADFEADHPNIQISLSTRFEPFQLSRERFDLAIHFGMNDWPDAKMTPLCNERMVAVSSPVFKDRFELDSPESILGASILHLETRLSVWGDWFEAVGISQNKALPGKQFDQFSMVIQAARAGLGAALLPEYLIEEELRSGELVELSAVYLETRNSYYVVQPIGSENPNARAFKDWIIGAIEQSQLSRAKVKFARPPPQDYAQFGAKSN